MNFASDNAGPVHPAVMAALAEANAGPAMPYGADPWTARATALIRETFAAPEAEIVLLPSGTAANAILLATLAAPWQRIFCSAVAHVLADEWGAVTLQSGAELSPVPCSHGRMTPEALSAAIAACPDGRRGPVTVTQLTEDGTLYAAEALAALGAVARAAGLALHMDGARLANAVAASGAAPADLTWRAGVTALSLGGTKTGLMGAEAAVLFDPALAAALRARCRRAGLTLSKQRFLGAQVAAWLADGLWLDLAGAANARAARLAAALDGHAEARLAHPVEGNMLFVDLAPALHARLQAAGVVYYHDGADPVRARLVCDALLPEAQIEALLALL